MKTLHEFIRDNSVEMLYLYIMYLTISNIHEVAIDRWFAAINGFIF